MADDALRELERAWRESGQLTDGQRFLHALARAGAEDTRRAEVRRDVLALQVSAAGLDVDSLRPLPMIPEPGCFRLDVPGAEAVRAWRTLRRQVEASGYWPLLLGDDDDVEAQRSILAHFDEPVDATLDQVADAYDPTRSPWAGPAGDWPAEVTPRHAFATPIDVVSGELKPRVVLGLLPVQEGAQAPAWLRFGGWSACPEPAEHVRVLRRWFDRYGAEPLAVTSNELECHVEHPPTDRRDAMQLAREQYAYCPELVDEGTETVARLAAGLLGGTAWTFWWE